MMKRRLANHQTSSERRGSKIDGIDCDTTEELKRLSRCRTWNTRNLLVNKMKFIKVKKLKIW